MPLGARDGSTAGPSEYVGNYNSHRPHRALDQRAPSAIDSLPAPLHHINSARLRKADRLGGIIHEYRMVA
ncbi:MAG: hypothetical protein M0Z46_10735 [Actinomycetota bacterium]|nr:hypothetical protein [Actinomycetota bacterium]MDA8359797.1 hypothetical protein [Actinomycetota bacterium]